MFHSPTQNQNQIARAQVFTLALAALSLFAATACNDSSPSRNTSTGETELSNGSTPSAETQPQSDDNDRDRPPHDDLPHPGIPGKKEGTKILPGGEDFEAQAAAALTPACLEAKHNLEALYSPIENCQQDSDCAYIGGDFLPVHPQTESVALDSCRWTRDLSVGNAGLATSYQLDLQLAREAVQQVCGESLNRSDCGSAWTFQPNAAPAPLCVQNRCVVHPDVMANR